MMSLTPLSTASLSKSFIISVCGVTVAVVAIGKKALRFPISPSSVPQGFIAYMKQRLLTGTITALATPFRDGQVSYEDLKKLVAYQIKAGINGLVPVGTTG